MDVLENVLEPDTEKKTSDLDVLKELFDSKDVKTKSELTIPQIILINQKRTIAKLLDWQSLDLCLTDFMQLMISNQRKGRREFVEGFKAEREQKKQEGGGVGGWLRDKMGFS